MSKRIDFEADDIIFRISHAADSLMFVAYGIELQNGHDCVEANAVHYIAYCLHEQSKRLRELVENRA